MDNLLDQELKKEKPIFLKSLTYFIISLNLIFIIFYNYSSIYCMQVNNLDYNEPVASFARNIFWHAVDIKFTVLSVNQIMYILNSLTLLIYINKYNER